MNIRMATIEDLQLITNVETECFPKAEAATENEFKERLTVYPNHFLLLEDAGTIVGFINGMVSNEKSLTDDMFSHAELHNEAGKWQMIFGLNTIPEYRRKGCAAQLMKQFIKDAKEQKRVGLVLTCKEKLIPYYSKFGFIDEGISDSEHGGAIWHQMRLYLTDKL